MSDTDKITISRAILGSFLGALLPVIGGVWILSAILTSHTDRLNTVEYRLTDHEARIRTIERRTEPDRTESTRYDTTHIVYTR